MKRMFAVLLLSCLCFSFLGCDFEESFKEGFSDKDSVKKYSTIQEYIKSQSIPTEQDFENSETTIDIFAEDGNALVYQYTFKKQVDVDKKDFDNVINSTLKGVSKAYVNVAKELSKNVNVKNPKVVLRYLNADGSKIYQKEFTKDTKIEENSTTSTKQIGE